MSSTENIYPFKVDLTKCDEEPIHLIPFIQSYACLIACNLPDYKVIHVSKNLEEKIGIDLETAMGSQLSQILDADTFHQLDHAIANHIDLSQNNPIRIGFEVEDQYLSYNLLAHIHNERLIIEIEPYDKEVSLRQYQYHLSKAIHNIQQVKELSKLYQTAAEEIKKLTDYDRVMVYKFDENGNGQVIAEAKNEALEPFLGLHYPATDIPKQARLLFLNNKVRLTSDVQGKPAEIFPTLGDTDQRPLDLSQAVARGVSPVHIEYLVNMGVSGTLSIAIELNGDLWGLFACHHYSPKFVSFDLRTACGFIGQIFSGHLMLNAANDYHKSLIEVGNVKSTLFEQMSKKWNLLEGLVRQEINVMSLFDCTGACIITDGNLENLGTTPSEEALRELVAWLDDNSKTAVFETNQLSRVFPSARAYEKIVAGVLAIRIIPEQNNYILWFRSEVLQEVKWGGNPEKAMVKSEDGMRLSPRKSFEKWSQEVKGESIPWEKHEVEVVKTLRNDIKDFIFEKYKEAQNINRELAQAYEELESFSYSVSHDLRSPLRSIKGFAGILLEDYSDRLDDYGKMVLDTIIDSSDNMNTMIQDMLTFSKTGKANLRIDEWDISKDVQKIFNEVALVNFEKFNQPQLIISPELPKVVADPTLFRQVLQNLISNAVKYSSQVEAPLIEVGGKRIEGYTQFFVKDNGIGFDMEHEKKIFNVFTRLVGEDKYEGNGIGLAIVKKIVEKHDGRIHVKSKLGEGTTFFVDIPEMH